MFRLFCHYKIRNLDSVPVESEIIKSANNQLHHIEVVELRHIVYNQDQLIV